MSNRIEEVKRQVLRALSHPESEDGLYLRNFSHLHEEDERPAVEASQDELLEALNQLVHEGRVAIHETCNEVVFQLVNGHKQAPAAN